MRRRVLGAGGGRSFRPAIEDLEWRVLLSADPASPVLAAPPVLSAADDSGVSSTDGITNHNGTAASPLDFNLSGISPANAYVTLYANGSILAGPVQASGGTTSFHIAGAGLTDGSYAITYTTSATLGGAQSAPSAAYLLQIQTSLAIAFTNPANGAVVSSLPNGQFVVTFSHPLAGLAESQSPIQTAAPFNPYDVFLVPRGPSGAFEAPFGVDSGDLPIPARVVYHVNADGTSEFVITPTEPMSTDVYALSVHLASFSDLAGNPLTDANNGYRTFLLQLPAVNTGQPLAVTRVSDYNGTFTINNNLIYQPDTIQVQFNKSLYAGAAANGSVQLIANPGPNYSLVPSVAAYSPTTDSIYLTPTAALNPGTVYAVRVAGNDLAANTSYVTDDQGFGSPGNPLPHTFYDTFTVANAPIGAGASPMQVAVDSAGNPKLLPLPSNTSEWTLPVGYASVQFTEPVNVSSLGRYSVMLIPRAGGLDPLNFDPGDVPLNAALAFNPNTNQIIVVPSQPVGDDVYLYSLSGIKATNGDMLLNNAGQPATGGNAAYFATFGLRLRSTTTDPGTSNVATTSSATPAVITPTPSAAHALVARLRPAQADSKRTP